MKDGAIDYLKKLFENEELLNIIQNNIDMELKDNILIELGEEKVRLNEEYPQESNKIFIIPFRIIITAIAAKKRLATLERTLLPDSPIIRKINILPHLDSFFVQPFRSPSNIFYWTPEANCHTFHSVILSMNFQLYFCQTPVGNCHTFHHLQCHRNFFAKFKRRIYLYLYRFAVQRKA